MKKYLLAALSLCAAIPASAMEMYRAQEVQPYQAQDIRPYQAQDIQPHQAQDIQPDRAQEVQPDRGQKSRRSRGDQVRPRPGRQIPQEATEPGVTVVTLPPAQPAAQPKAEKNARTERGAKALVGVWQTNIPGAVYTTPSGVPGYDTLHVSSGAAAGLLRINANGTYSWNSYGGKKGKWVETGDAEYPIEIVDTVENRRWRVGYSSSKGALIIWSGSFWYEGRRASVRK